jgi:GTP-binding protein
VGATFLGSFVSGDLPEQKEPRVAFLGRSNVGKSSLINLLAGSRIARVSKTPGRTQILNLFGINGQWILGDFPGFGFAQVSKETRKSWERLIRRFLTAKNFQHAIHIVDARHVEMEADLVLSDWLKSQGITETVVLNKVDKLNQKMRVDAERKARNVFSGQPLLFVSTVTGEGKKELEKILQNMTSMVHPQRRGSAVTE